MAGKSRKILLVFFVMISCEFLFTCNVKATTTPTTTRDYNLIAPFFNVQVAPTVQNEHFKVDVGGKSLTNFKNMGVIEQTDASIIFKAIVTLNFACNIYTDYSIDDIFSSVSKIEQSRLWLDLQTDPNWGDQAGRHLEYLYAKYYDYVYGSVIATGINQAFKIDLDLESLEEHYIEATGTNKSEIIISIPTASSIESRAVDNKVMQLDTYKDLFTEAQMIKLDSVDMRKTEVSDKFDQSNWDSDARSGLSGKISDLQLGVGINPNVDSAHPLDSTNKTPYAVTVQQGVTIGLTDGKILQKSGLNQFTFVVQNKPEIIQYKQKIRTRSAELDIDTEDGSIIKDAGVRYCSPVNQQDFDRYCGHRVNNNDLQQNISIDVALFCALPMSVSDQAYYLGFPEFKKGDIIWDVSLFGDTGASLIFTEKEDLFAFFDTLIGQIIKYIIIIAVIAIVIKTFPSIIAGASSLIKKKIDN